MTERRIDNDIRRSIKSIERREEGKKKTWDTGWYVKLLGERIVNKNGGCDFISIVDLSEDNWEEYKEDILDEKEKEYLSAVIKPFRDRITHIRKMEIDDHKQYICIKLKKYNYNDYDIENSRYEHIALPNFEKNTMYKNMKADKEYTLKELGL